MNSLSVTLPFECQTHSQSSVNWASQASGSCFLKASQLES